MSKLNLTFYKGEDLYCDGPSEDELLALVSSGADPLQVLKEHHAWELLYHLSDMRENLLEWYDFKKDADVLEIGAGCGAVTGILCKKCGHVTAVDLSKKRSQINALRHRDYDNLEILVGNFEDIVFEKTYDYITLIGVLEYAASYIHAADPFHAMLEKVLGLLSPGGSLIIAIENRVGMKYISGAREDHTGGFFDGLNDYPAKPGVRTFTKQELETLLLGAGFEKQAFYYPMPDYKLPRSVYAQGSEPASGTVRFGGISYDQDRLKLFDEDTGFDMVCASGVFDMFANAFLVVCSPTASEDDGSVRTLSVKYNRLRRPGLRIATQIYERADGIRYVVKRTLDPAARGQIAAIGDNCRRLGDAYTDLTMLMPAAQDADRIAFPFVKEMNLETLLAGLLREPEILVEKLRKSLDRITGLKADYLAPFEMTDAFFEVFGDHTGETHPYAMLNGRPAGLLTDIDVLFDNIIPGDDSWMALDCEWVFNFPVPLEFVRYRCLFYFYQRYAAELVHIGYPDVTAFLAVFGMDADLAELFRDMECRFQMYVTGPEYEEDYMYHYRKPVRTFTEYISMIRDPLQARIGEQEARIRELEAANAVLTQELDGKRAHVAHLEGIVVEKSHALDDLNHEMALKEQHVQNLTAIIEDYRANRWVRLGEKVGGLINRS